MKPPSWTVAGSVCLAGLAVGGGISFVLITLGGSPLIVTPWLALLFILVAAGILVGGLAVRRLKRGDSVRLSSIQASRVAFFARSSIYNGSVFVGFLAGIVGVGLTRLWAQTIGDSVIRASVALAGALIMTIVAGIVENWCRDDSGMDSESHQPNRPPTQDRGVTGTACQTDRGDKI